MKTRFNAWKSSLYLRAALLLLFSFTPMFAQTVVTTNAGDESVGSLGWAVTTLNAVGDGSISFAIANSVTLTQPLPVFANNVTFFGNGNTLIGQDNSQSLFLFQQGLNQQGNLNFQNNGAYLTGFDVAVTAANWTMGTYNVSDLYGTNAATISTSGGVNVDAANGGNASATVGTWIIGLANYVNAGVGGGVTDTNGSGDMGGTGGIASASGISIVLPGYNEFHINGGQGGSVIDLGTGTNTGGNGGSASGSFGTIFVNIGGDFGVSGGAGGMGVTGGNGGAASLTAGAVSLYGTLKVQGGVGGNGISVGGDGGSGYVSFGSCNGNTGSNFQLTGGDGGDASSGAGGAGGNVFAAGGAVTIIGGGLPGPIFNESGGNGGIGLSGGDGGSAGISLTSLVIGSSANFKVAGGGGNQAADNDTPGVGGQGGDTTFTLGAFSMGVSTTLDISSGNGGAGGKSTISGGTGGSGGAGGDLAVTFGTLDLGTDSKLNLIGGSGGNGGAVVSGGTGGAGGDAGNVSLAVNAVTMAMGGYLSITGGGVGNGGNAGTNGPQGATGQAWASIGDLEGGAGTTVDMSGNAQLLLGGGNFSGSINGSESLVTSGLLILAGRSDFSGGTTVNGTLLVDTGGTVGTGTIVNTNILEYLNSANAGSSTILNNFVLDFNNSSSAGNAFITNNHVLDFTANSTAGSATITGNSGSLIQFSGAASGGSARFILNSGGVLDISNGSSSVTVGSIEGAGDVSLGANGLATGVDNLSTTFSGIIGDGGAAGGTGGSLTKLGTGTLTLSDSNSFTGSANVDAGVLAVGNSLALGTGPVTVSGGTLSTAGVPLTFQVTNYTQGFGGTLQMGLGGSGASSQDHMNITGAANLNGTLDLNSYGTLSAMPVGGTPIILVNASSVSGMFQQVNENYNGIRLLPIYLASAVELESIIPSFQAVGITPNQKAVGADLDTIALNPKAYNLMTSIGILSNTDMQAAYGQLTPEDFTGLFQAGFEGALSRTALVDQRLSQLMDDVDNTVWLPGFSSTGKPWFAANLPAQKEAAMAPRQYSPWGGFVSGDGGFFDISADANAAGYKVTTFGLTGAGADYRLSREAVVGLMVGYGHTDVTLGTGGTLTADGGQVGLYGLFYSEGFYAGGLVEGGINSYGTQRLGYGGVAKGTSQGNQYDGALELGYQFKQDLVKVGPMAQVQYSSVGMNAFTEQGSLAPLTVPAQTETSLLSRLGVRANSRWAMGPDSTLTPSLQLAWEHENNFQGGTFQAGFGTGDSFTVAGPQVGQDGLMAGAGLGISFGKSLTVSLNYQGEFGRTNLTASQIGGGMKFGF